MDAGSAYSEIARPRNRQHNVNGLTPQTRYKFRIAAVNECGPSEWSEELVAWTAGAPPPAPAPPSLATASSSALGLAWERRADEEFTLQMDDAARGHGFLPVYSGAECAYSCEGLRKATDYRFRLRCETADGQGPWSSEVTYRTLPERPSPPGRPMPKGKIHSRAFRLRWDPPSDDGGIPIESYTLELDGGEGYRCAYRGVEREAQCERLRPGVGYRARVSCATAAGASDWSAVETVATEPTCPGGVAAPWLPAPPRATAATVRWRAPTDTGGAPVTEYRLEVAGPDGAVLLGYSGLEVECTVRGLVPGHQYRLWIIVCNKVGAGPPSAPLVFTSAPAPPDAPEPPQACVEGPRTARLEWVAPRNNGAPIVDYRLEMSSSTAEESFAEIYRGLETRYVINELTPFTAYLFRVCASNSAGRGPYSGLRDALTPRAPPAAPNQPKCEATADSLHIQWREPNCHGAEILNYKLEIDDNVLETEGPVTERTIEGLTADTAFRIRICAVNEVDAGEWSEPLSASTRPPPPPPPQLRLAHAAHNYLKLDWDAPRPGDTIQYCVEMRAAEGREFRPVYRGNARSCKLKKLRESTQYWVRIRASEERSGRGEWGAAVSCGTLAAPPPAPHPPTAALLAPRRLLLSWDAVEDVDNYLLQCARAKDNIYKQVYSGPETQHEIEEVEYGAEYLLRVCGVRSGVAGPWSTTSRFTVPVATAANTSVTPGVTRARRSRGQGLSTLGLTPKGTALLLAGGFLLLAVLVAALLQSVVAPRP